jgi:Tfp pilus assembly protein FimT
MSRNRKEAGYSLVEALVVLAIIGLVSLVTVPNFISLYRANKFKTSLQQVNNDIRSARQLAVTKNKLTRVSFATGVGERQYEIAEATGFDPATATWTVLKQRELIDTVYFHSATFSNIDSSADGTKDIVFRNNGTVVEPKGFVLRSSDNIPYNQYSVELSTVGRMTSERSKY